MEVVRQHLPIGLEGAEGAAAEVGAGLLTARQRRASPRARADADTRARADAPTRGRGHRGADARTRGREHGRPEARTRGRTDGSA